MLTAIRQRVSAANIKPLDIGEEGVAQAAVLVALTNEEANPSVILTRRSENLSSHRGEVALPGGKWEPGDPSLEFTALRESHEEIGLEPMGVDMVGALENYHTKAGFTVTPYVGIVSPTVELVGNPDELDAIFKVPLRYFNDTNRVRTDVFTRNGERFWTPAYHFGEFEIWGFTARVLTRFLHDYGGIQTRFESTVPVRDFGIVD